MSVQSAGRGSQFSALASPSSVAAGADYRHQQHQYHQPPSQASSAVGAASAYGSAVSSYQPLSAVPYDGAAAGAFGHPLDYLTMSTSTGGNNSALPYSSAPPTSWTTFDSGGGSVVYTGLSNRSSVSATVGGTSLVSLPPDMSSPVHTDGRPTAGGGPPEYSMEQAAEESYRQRFVDTDLWKIMLFYRYVDLSRMNRLNVFCSIGYVWLCVMSLVGWIWLVGGWSLSNTSREVFTIFGFLFTTGWLVVVFGCALTYLKAHKRLSNRHNLMVISPIVVIAVFAYLGLIALTVSNHRYTNIADFDEHDKDSLELSKDHHWCNDEKVTAGLSFYVAMVYLSVAALVALPVQAMSWTAHKFPESVSNIIDFSNTAEKYHRQRKAKDYPDNTDKIFL